MHAFFATEVNFATNSPNETNETYSVRYSYVKWENIILKHLQR